MNRSTTRRCAPLLVGALLSLTASGCVEIARSPLPTPVAPTRGGTPVPADGVGLEIGYGDGLQGQELLRKEIGYLSALVGFAQRASLSLGVYGGFDATDPLGFLASGKARLGAPAGPSTSTAAQLGFATVGQTEGDNQDESLTVLDLAVPTEWNLVRSEEATTLGLYGGPRAVWERYRDRLRPEEDFTGVMPGLLGGVHFAHGSFPFVEAFALSFQLYGEGTVLWRPETSYLGTRYEGGVIVPPTAGIVFQFSDPFDWGR